MHLVLFAALVVGCHLIAADQQTQRFGGIGHFDTEVGGLRAIEPNRPLGPAGVQVGIDVDEAGNLLRYWRPDARSASAAPAGQGPASRTGCRRPSSTAAAETAGSGHRGPHAVGHVRRQDVRADVGDELEDIAVRVSESGFSFVYTLAVLRVPAPSPATVTIV